MALFVKTSVIHAPVEEVFGFHQRSDALELLTPKFPPAKVLSKTGGIETGSRVVLRVGFSKWVALHTDFELNHFFVDEQIEGPFAKWIHRHEFENISGFTRLTDRVNYELPGGPIANALVGWSVNLALHQLFAHRHAITRRYCERQ